MYCDFWAFASLTSFLQLFFTHQEIHTFSKISTAMLLNIDLKVIKTFNFPPGVFGTFATRFFNSDTGSQETTCFPVEFIDAQTHCRHDRFGFAALGWKRQGVMDRWDRGGVQHVRNIFLNSKCEKPHKSSVAGFTNDGSPLNFVKSRKSFYRTRPRVLGGL